MKILALSTNYKYHQDLLERLHSKYGIIAEFATSHKPELEQENREYYRKYNTKLIDGKDFYLISRIYKIVPERAPALSKRMLEHFSDIERDFYTLSDRYSYFPRSFRYRKRLFRHGLRFWLDFFGENKIDALFSICTPHNFPDYLAFHVAKYLGIKTLLTTDVMINDHVLLLEDYRQGFKVPVDYLAGKSDEEIKALINPKLLAATLAESRFIGLSKAFNDQMLKLKNVNSKTVKSDKLGLVIKFLGRAKKFLRLAMFKPKFKAAFAMNGQFPDNTRRVLRIISGRRLKKLKTAYEKLAVYPDFNKKFVYFAMHLTPERTTQPEAEIFEDHLLAIEILARSVPEDWLVYVKENPGQYGRKLNLVNGRHFRDASDYADFTRLPNVKLLRQDVKTADLLAHARIAASLKGSIGWESLVSGKPCIIFANAFYSACRSAYRINSVAECQAAIREMAAKSAADVHNDILKYLSYMQDKLIIGNMGGHESLAVAGEPYNILIDGLAKDIAIKFKTA